jgi:hypothetical protein
MSQVTDAHDKINQAQYLVEAIFLAAIAVLWCTWRARQCSRAYRRHMERRASIMGRAGR